MNEPVSSLTTRERQNYFLVLRTLEGGILRSFPFPSLLVDPAARLVVEANATALEKPFLVS